MPIKILAVALACLAGLSPAFGQGRCGHERQAQITCAEGQSWDDATQKCVTVGS